MREWENYGAAEFEKLHRIQIDFYRAILDGGGRRDYKHPHFDFDIRDHNEEAIIAEQYVPAATIEAARDALYAFKSAQVISPENLNQA